MDKRGLLYSICEICLDLSHCVKLSELIARVIPKKRRWGNPKN
jgi:hypothetical protein